MTREDLVALRRKNLQKWIDDNHHGRQADFIAAHDLNQGEISGLLRKKSFGEVKARNLEDQCGMPDRYLDTVHDNNVKQFHVRETKPNYDADTISIIQNTDVAGAMGSGLILSDQPGQITEWKVTMEWAQKNIPANTGNKNLRIVTGFGDSMIGMFNPGDPILIDTGVKEVKVDGVYFFRVGDEGFIKRLQRIPGEGIRVISANKEYEAWTIKPDMDFHVIGKVLRAWNGSEF